MNALRTPARSKSGGISEEFPQGISEGNFGAMRGNFVSGGFMRIFVFVVVAALLISVTVNAGHQPDGRKDFEDEAVLSTLPSGWLQGSSSGFTDAKVTAQNGPIGNRAWGHEGLAGGVSRTTLTATDGDRTCSSETNPAPEFLPNLTFAMKLLEYPTGDSVYVGLTFIEDPDITRPSSDETARNPQHHQMRLQINQTGVPVAQIHGDTDTISGADAPVTVSAGAFSPLALNTWYNVSFIDINVGTNTGANCPATTNIGGLSDFSYNVQILELEQTRSVNADSLLAACRADDSGFTSCNSSPATHNVWQLEQNRFYVKGGASDTTERLLVDNIIWEIEGAPTGGVTEGDSISYADLTDIDASNSRNTFIVRYANGTSVATVNGGDMTQIASETGTCLVDGGVSVTDTHALRFRCDGGGVPDEIAFTDSNLSSLELSSCGFEGAPAPTCDTVVGLGSDTDIVEMEILSDPTFYNSGPGGVPTTIAKFGFTTADTSFHPARLEWQRFQEDTAIFHKTAVTYGPVPPEAPCTREGISLWVSGSELKAYAWFDDQTEAGFGADDGGTEKGVSIAGTGWSPVSFHDCGLEHIAIKVGSNIIKMQISDNTNLLTVPGSNCGTGDKAFAISGDGDFLACANGNILNFTSGEIAGTFTPRAGNHERLYLDQFAQYLWHATDTGITRYEIFNVTTGEPVGGAGPPGPTPTTTPPGLPGGGGTGTGNDPDNAIGAIKTLIDDAWGWDPLVSDWIFTMIIIGFAVMFAAMKLGGSPIVIALFALLGTGVAMAFGYMGVWLILVIIFIFIALAGRRMFGGGDTEAT